MNLESVFLEIRLKLELLSSIIEVSHLFFLIKKNTKCEWRREVRETEIRSLEIDFDRDVLMINGKDVTDKPVIVTLPGPEDSFPYRKL